MAPLVWEAAKPPQIRPVREAWSVQTPRRLQLRELLRVSRSGQTPTCGPSSARNWKITNPKAKRTLSRPRVTRIPILPEGKTLCGDKLAGFLDRRRQKSLTRAKQSLSGEATALKT